jgi:hypothetical protein
VNIIPAAKHLEIARTPVHMTQIELGLAAEKALSGSGDGLGDPLTGRTRTLVRLHGCPLGVVEAEIGEPRHAAAVLIAAARLELADALAKHIRADGIGDLGRIGK